MIFLKKNQAGYQMIHEMVQVAIWLQGCITAVISLIFGAILILLKNYIILVKYWNVWAKTISDIHALINFLSNMLNGSEWIYICSHGPNYRNIFKCTLTCMCMYMPKSEGQIREKMWVHTCHICREVIGLKQGMRGPSRNVSALLPIFWTFCGAKVEQFAALQDRP